MTPCRAAVQMDPTPRAYRRAWWYHWYAVGVLPVAWQESDAPRTCGPAVALRSHSSGQLAGPDAHHSCTVRSHASASEHPWPMPACSTSAPCCESGQLYQLVSGKLTQRAVPGLAVCFFSQASHSCFTPSRYRRVADTKRARSLMPQASSRVSTCKYSKHCTKASAEEASALVCFSPVPVHAGFYACTS